MEEEAQTPLNWWERFLTRTGDLVIAADGLLIFSRVRADEVGKAAHRCRACGLYRRDDIVDPLSKEERVVCGNCGASRVTREVFSWNVFKRQARREHWEMCMRYAEEQIRTQHVDLSPAAAVRLRKKLARQRYRQGIYKTGPDNRGGKTFRELETLAVSQLVATRCWPHDLMR